MSETGKNLGRLVSVHPTSPALLQRGAILVVLSFLFFLAMLAAFYARQHFGYFLLATAFLLVYLATMFSLMTQIKRKLSIYENGFAYHNQSYHWPQIDSIRAIRQNEEEKQFAIDIHLKSGKTVTVPATLHESVRLTDLLERALASA